MGHGVLLLASDRKSLVSLMADMGPTSQFATVTPCFPSSLPFLHFRYYIFEQKHITPKICHCGP